jgi:hypothetical protein
VLHPRFFELCRQHVVIFPTHTPSQNNVRLENELEHVAMFPRFSIGIVEKSPRAKNFGFGGKSRHIHRHALSKFNS